MPEVYDGDEPLEPIDIILITHGKLEELTKRCVPAIYAHTKAPFHLIVIDDSTPDMDDGKDETPQYFKRLKIEQTNVTYFHSDVPFTSGNQIFNLGFTLGTNRFIATVMNSVMVEPDWDVVAVQMMAANPKIGITGLKCLKLGWGEGQDGQIESAGLYIHEHIPCDLGRDEAGHRRSNSYPVFCVQWAFALLRREAVEGNLREDLFNGFVGFDDIDNTVFLRYKGWEAWYCGLGAGYHQTHATRRSDEDDKFIANRKNGEIFYKRWGYWERFRKFNRFAPEYFPDADSVEFLCNADDLPLTVDSPPTTVVP